jgi:hypothetical protein
MAIPVSAPPNQSEYARNRARLAYQVVVINGASEPRMTDLSREPGVIYYFVTEDKQPFWVTMTELNEEVARAATLKRISDYPEEKSWLVTAAGKDYGLPGNRLWWHRSLPRRQKLAPHVSAGKASGNMASPFRDGSHSGAFPSNLPRQSFSRTSIHPRQIPHTQLKCCFAYHVPQPHSLVRSAQRPLIRGTSLCARLVDSL